MAEQIDDDALWAGIYSLFRGVNLPPETKQELARGFYLFVVHREAQIKASTLKKYLPQFKQQIKEMTRMLAAEKK